MALSKITAASITDNSITNTQINSSAAIAKSKLAALAISNSDIDNSAAIAQSKLATLAITHANMPVGSIIQTVTLNKSTGNEFNNYPGYVSLYSDADCIKITPSATSSKIIIHYMLDRGNGSISGEAQSDYRIITTINGAQSNYVLSHGVINISNTGYRYGSLGSFTGTVISPNTTSEVKFNIQTKVQSSQKGTLNPYGHSCGITAMEIKG